MQKINEQDIPPVQTVANTFPAHSRDLASTRALFGASFVCSLVVVDTYIVAGNDFIKFRPIENAQEPGVEFELIHFVLHHSAALEPSEQQF